MGILGFFRRLGEQQKLRSDAFTAYEEGRLSEALSGLEAFLQGHRSDVDAWDTLGRCKLDLGDFAGAETALKNCQEADESYVVDETLALIFAERDHDYQRALDLLQEQLRIYTNNVGKPELIEERLAWVYFFTDDSAQAKEYFDRAKASIDEWQDTSKGKDAQYAGLHYRMGVLTQALTGNTQAATVYLQRAIALSPESIHARKAKEQLEKMKVS